LGGTGVGKMNVFCLDIGPFLELFSKAGGLERGNGGGGIGRAKESKKHLQMEVFFKR
jgi:hypothetical protein